MCDINLKPFEACAAYYKVSPDNMFDVNDCCFQSCYRYQHLGYDVQKCLDNCRQGQDVLTYVAGKSPSQYIRAFKAPPDHDKYSIYGNLVKNGVNPQQALKICLESAQSDEDTEACIIDHDASLKEQMPEAPKVESFQTTTPKTENEIGKVGVVIYVILLAIICAVFYYGFKNIIFSSSS